MAITSQRPRAGTRRREGEAGVRSGRELSRQSLGARVGRPATPRSENAACCPGQCCGCDWLNRWLWPHCREEAGDTEGKWGAQAGQDKPPTAEETGGRGGAPGVPGGRKWARPQPGCVGVEGRPQGSSHCLHLSELSGWWSRFLKWGSWRGRGVAVIMT